MSLEFDGPMDAKAIHESNSTKSVDKSDKDHIQMLSENSAEAEM